MVLVSVNQLKPGVRLERDVMTARDNLLLAKGVMLSPREIEILSSFLIQKVYINGSAATPEQLEEDVQQQSGKKASEPHAALNQEYSKLFDLLKRSFSLVGSGAALPVLDIRNQIEALLGHIGEYKVLLFKPPKPVLQDYHFHHSVQVAMTSYKLAKWHGFEQKDLIPIAIAGLMKDIGNAKLDPALLAKSSSLTSSELAEVRAHTKTGYTILKNVAAFNEGTKLVAVQHHEREDGSGYPLGLKGDKIHPYSKVVAIADIYHAMSTNRSYRQAISPYIVLEELLQYSFGKLDPAIVRTFITKVTQFHTGTIVKLNDNRIGEIVFSQREYPTRPWVNVNGSIINLTTDRSLYIQEVIQQ